MLKVKKGGVGARGAAFRYEVLAALLVTITLFLSVSLITYNPHDSSWCFFSTENNLQHNYCGLAGANCAAVCMFLLGSASFGVLMLLGFCSYLMLARRSFAQEWDRLIAGVALVFTLAAMQSMWSVDFWASSYPGGALGAALFAGLHHWFDLFGAALILHAFMVVCLIIILRFSFIGLVHLMLRSVRGIFNDSPFINTSLQTIFSFFTTVWRSVKMRTRAAYAGFFNHLAPSHGFDDQASDVGAQTIAQDEFWSSFSSQIEPQEVVNFEPSPAPIERTIDEQLFSIGYQLPPVTLFSDTKKSDSADTSALEQDARILEEKLEHFGVSGSVVSIKRGPVVTLYEYQPAIDTKISKIVALEDDLALALRAMSIRIIAPIPGKSVVGFEVANKQRNSVLIGSIIKSADYNDTGDLLPLILGVDTVGSTVIVDLAKMPHLLVAGSTGSGKSVALNAMLVSLLCKRTPQELNLILVDPKRLEFACYADCPHLIFPIITEPRKAVPVLSWVAHEMDARYKTMAEHGARNISDYNATASAPDRMPYIVMVIDELADLMITAGRDIEDLLARITQMARAAGIHLIVATQRPSVDVITGMIKVNFPSRISFKVTSKIDSRTILDCTGAEKLLGRGDMLFMDSHDARLKRVHGAYVSDQEIGTVVGHMRLQGVPTYKDLTVELPVMRDDMHEDDELMSQVLQFLQQIDEVSISLLQRKFRIG